MQICIAPIVANPGHYGVLKWLAFKRNGKNVKGAFAVARTICYSEPAILSVGGKASTSYFCYAFENLGHWQARLQSFASNANTTSCPATHECSEGRDRIRSDS